MSEGVVADDVSGLDDLAGNLRLLVDVASDQKKSCAYVVFCEASPVKVFPYHCAVGAMDW